jgi:hypothetical protein
MSSMEHEILLECSEKKNPALNLILNQMNLISALTPYLRVFEIHYNVTLPSESINSTLETSETAARLHGANPRASEHKLSTPSKPELSYLPIRQNDNSLSALLTTNGWMIFFYFSPLAPTLEHRADFSIAYHFYRR